MFCHSEQHGKGSMCRLLPVGSGKKLVTQQSQNPGGGFDIFSPMKPKVARNLAQIWLVLLHKYLWGISLGITEPYSAKIRHGISAFLLIRSCSPIQGSDSVCFLKLISCLKKKTGLWCKELLCIKCESGEISTLPGPKTISAEHLKALFPLQLSCP